MKIWDKIKISFKAVINSKSRALFTSMIVFIVGTLILSILLIGTNFATNLNKFQTTYIQDSVTTTLIRRYKVDDKDNTIYNYFTNEDITKAINFSKNFSEVIHSFEIDSSSIYFNYNDYVKKVTKQADHPEYFQDPKTQVYTKVLSFNYQGEFKILDGRCWNNEDAGKNNIWVTKSFVQNQASQAVKIYPGKTIYLNKYYSYYDVENGVSRSLLYSDEFIICGIVDDVIMNKRQMDIIMDIEFASKKYFTECINSKNLMLTYRAPNGKYNFNNIYKKTSSLIDGLKGTLLLEDNFVEVESDLILTMKVTRLLEVAVVGLSFLIGSIILLLSVGSVANTIIISVDKNKKFIGLLKAIGLNQKDTIKIIQIESAIIIGAGITLATFFVMLIKNIYKNILVIIFDVFSTQYAVDSFNVNFNVPLYMPILITAGFLALALVFSRTSLQDIAKMDPISIISEVS